MSGGCFFIGTVLVLMENVIISVSDCTRNVLSFKMGLYLWIETNTTIQNPILE